MTSLIEYTKATGIMFTSYGLMRYVKHKNDIDRCTKYNIMFGMGLGFMTGGIMLKQAYSS